MAPGILGLPLASPSRRAAAMAIDGILVLLLAKAGAVFLGLAAATLLFRASRPDPSGGFGRWSVRTGLRIAGAVLIFVVIMNVFGAARERLRRERDVNPPAAAPVEGAENLHLELSPAALLKLGPPLLALRNAPDSATVAHSATEVLRTAKESGASSEDLHEARSGLVELMGERADSSEIGAVDQAIRAIAGVPPAAENADSLMLGYIAARERDDTIAAAAYRDSIKQAIAGSELSRLEASSSRQQARADSLEDELGEASKAKGVRQFIAGAADDLGVGFGWSAVYFTAFLALWRGQTPGKRVAGIRVLRLDGKPLGWWISFERFGGYAASFSVGLMGFFQILWDRNRQGLHDKACETVVVRERVQPRPRR